MKAYKVVRSGDDGFVSAVMDGEYELRYIVGKCTTPRHEHILSGKTRGICCFDTLEHAKSFMMNRNDYHILLVKGSGRRTHSYLCRINRSLFVFYKLLKQKKSVADMAMEPPEGTLFFDSVYVIEEVT